MIGVLLGKNPVSIIWWLEQRQSTRDNPEGNGITLVEVTESDLVSDDEVETERQRLTQWLVDNPYPTEFRFVEGHFTDEGEFSGFSGYGNRWEDYDGDSLSDDIHTSVDW